MSEASFPSDRVVRLMDVLERMAAGELDARAEISPAHDVLDAIAHSVNVLVAELRYAVDGVRRARDDAERANHEKSTFLRNVSHEIRTPIAAILGLADLLAQPDLPGPRQSKILERIQSNGRSLLSLIEEILDLSRIEAGKMAFDRVEVAPHSLIAEVIGNLAAQAAEKGIRLEVSEEVGTPRRITTDPARVRQILTNVIGNAIKFTADGRVAVHMRDEAGRLCVDVRDTGIGVSEEERPRLFAPFGQADSSIARRFGGAGLGLALSQRLCEGLGGQLSLMESRPGVGSTFRIALPLDKPGPEARNVAPPATPASPSLDGVRILLADDNEDIRESTAALLEMSGATVHLAIDGEQALGSALASSFDVILMDVRMPRLDGLEVTRRLRMAGYDTAILALTADAVKEHRDECLAAGCDDYITKPISYRHLLDRIVRAVDRAG